MPRFKYYSFLVTLLVGQMHNNLVNIMGGDSTQEFAQDKVVAFREGEGSVAKKKFYHNFLPYMHAALFREYPPRVLPQFITDLENNKLGEIFQLETTTYLRVYGSKVPPKVLPTFVPNSLICFELVRQLSDDAKIILIKKKKRPDFLQPPCRIGNIAYNSYQSMLFSGQKMDEYCFDEMEWRPFDPHGYNKQRMEGAARMKFVIQHQPDAFEDALRIMMKTGQPTEEVLRTYPVGHPGRRFATMKLPMAWSLALKAIRQSMKELNEMSVRSLRPADVDIFYQAQKTELVQVQISRREQTVVEESSQISLLGAPSGLEIMELSMPVVEESSSEGGAIIPWERSEVEPLEEIEEDQLRSLSIIHKVPQSSILVSITFDGVERVLSDYQRKMF